MEESEETDEEGSGKSMPREVEDTRGADMPAQPVEAARKRSHCEEEVKPKATRKNKTTPKRGFLLPH